MVFVQHLAGAVRRVRQYETAFASRDAGFILNVMGDWRDSGETPRHVAWVREAWSSLAPLSTGAVYLNYLGRDDTDTQPLVRKAFGPNFSRFVEIKTKYDPTNLFRLNQNIEPSGLPNNRREER